MSLILGEKVRSPPSHVWNQHKSDIEQLYMVQKCTLKEVMKAMEAKGFKASEQQYKIKFNEWHISKYKKRGAQNRADRAYPNTSQTDGTRVANPQPTNPQLANPQLANSQLANHQLANLQLANPQLPALFVDASIGDVIYDMPDHMTYHPHTSEPMTLGIQQGEGAVVPSIPRTPGKVRQPIHLAARSGFLDMVKLLLEKDSTCASIPNSDGVTAIHIAAQQGHLEIVRLLVECHGVDVNAATPDSMRTPIYQAAQNDHADIAAQNGHVEVVKILLEAGAQIDPHKDSWDNKTPSPLCLAACKGHVEVAELLIQKGADVNFPLDPSKCFPLHLAAQNGHTEVVRLLIKNGADVDAGIEDDWSPLMIAAFNNHIGIIHLLLEHNANVNAENKDGATALWIASQQGHVQVIQKLLDKGAKSLPTRSDRKRPIHQAALNGHLEAVKLLLKVNPGDINIGAEEGATPLFLASHGETASHLEVVRYLIEQGADIVIY
ncbi:ankyrin repeat-containing domain protein [Trichoderma austrokoningii]